MPRLLVADDGEDERELYCRFLRRWGYDVHIAANAADAVSTAGAQLPDAIVIDMGMPLSLNGEHDEFAGIVAIRQIRLIPPLATIPIIALTAQAGEADIASIIESGCTAVLTKPLMDWNQLRQLLKQLLEPA
jgi:CheY-like chemotaxis protein